MFHSRVLPSRGGNFLLPGHLCRMFQLSWVFPQHPKHVCQCLWCSMTLRSRVPNSSEDSSSPQDVHVSVCTGCFHLPLLLARELSRLSIVFLLSFSITCSIRNIATFFASQCTLLLVSVRFRSRPLLQSSALFVYPSRSTFQPVERCSGNPHRGPDDTPDPVSDFPDLAVSRMPPR